MKRNTFTPMAVPEMLQSTCQYVSILDTLKSLFKQGDFRSLYFNGDPSSNHICVAGKYEYFCCGELYKKKEFFTQNPNAVLINIAIDDFQPLNPLQSKAATHKLCAVYFTIRNLPHKYCSRLNNIFLVCICYADDLSTKETDINDIWKLIVEELRILEKDGIDIGDNIKLKGTLAHMSFDNLGGNIAYCMARSFSAHHYCRMCLLDINECRTKSVEVPSKIRTLNSYEKQINIIENSEKIVYKNTGGIERYCSLNDLENFHIFENICADTMHDINEGAIPFLLKHLFEYCFKKDIFTEKSLQGRIQSYDFGSLNRSNTPSLLCIDKKNLNQNASQSKCLFMHLPFILSEYRHNEELGRVWICVETLLEIVQIIHSYVNSEDDINILEQLVSKHLNNVKDCFQVNLTPKHHLMTHYGRIIRTMGPLIQMNMIRFEAKHKTLKSYLQNTNNHMNLPKHIAKKHQNAMSRNPGSYEDIFLNGKKTLLDINFVQNNINLLQNLLVNGDQIYCVQWCRINEFRYAPHLFILYNQFMFELEKILFIDSEFFFLCKKWNFMELDTFSKAAKIILKEPIDRIVINFSEITDKKTYEKKYLNDEFYIVFDTLEFKKLFK